MKYLYIIIIIFASPFSSVAMDLCPKQDNDSIRENFSNGILQYQKGNTKEAALLLDHAYAEFQKNRLNCFIPTGILHKAYSILSVIEDQRGNFETALSLSYQAFPNGGNNADKGIIFRHLAKKAHVDANFVLEQKYYQEAFKLFQGAALSDRRAAKYYEHALYNGIGCQYNVSDIRKHHFDQVKTHFPFRIEGILEKPYDRALQKLVKFAQNDLITQCILAKAYSSQKDSKEYGTIFSYDQSLFWCEKAIINLSKIPSTSPYPTSIFSLSMALNNLSIAPISLPFRSGTPKQEVIPNCLSGQYNDSCYTSLDNSVEEKASILKKYFDVLSAIKNRRLQEIEKLCTTEKIDLQSVIMHLLCSKIDDTDIKYIKDMIFDCDEFIQFCNYESEIAIPILKSLILNSSSPTNNNLLHAIIGGYEYRKNNFAEAYDHLTQCSDYKNDVYLQTITLLAYTASHNFSSIQPITQLFEKKLTKQNNEKHEKAIKAIAQLSGYVRSNSAEEALKLCIDFLPNYILSPTIEPFAYIHFLCSLYDLERNNHIIPSTMQEKISTIRLYYQFFSALKSNNKPRIDSILIDPMTKSISLRPIFLQTLCTNKKKSADKIKEWIFEEESFKQFYISDSFFIKPLLESILNNPQQQSHIKEEHGHYILGGFSYLENNYEDAHKHFIQSKYNDLYTQTKLVQTNSSEYKIATVNILPTMSQNRVANLKPLPKNHRNHASPLKDNRSAIAQQLIVAMCSQECPSYIEYLLNNQLYSKAYTHLLYLAQLQLPGTYPTLSTLFSKIEKHIETQSSTPQQYCMYMELPERINLLKSIESIIKEKHSECLCECLVSALSDEINNRCIEGTMYLSTNLSQTKKLFNYLTCSLNHGQLNQNQKEIRKTACGEIARNIAIIDNSLDLFDQAIACGDNEALYHKALLMEKLPDKNNTLSEQLALLEKHAHSSSNQRTLSLQKLGRYYFDLPGPENKKKSFLYLKEAEDLDKQSLKTSSKELLLLFYSKNVKECLEVANFNKTIFYLTMFIDNSDTLDAHVYYNLLFLRASLYYKHNQFVEAYADLIKIIKNKEIHNKRNKALALWMTGIIELLITKTISDHIVLCLGQGYGLLQLLLKDSTLDIINQTIREFDLCDNENVFNIIKENINVIFAEKKIDLTSLEFCSIIGKIIPLQVPNSDDERRKFGVQCLLYAAEHNYLDAQLCLANLTETEVSLCDKIYYLENSMYKNKNNKELTHPIQEVLTLIYPESIHRQANIIINLAERNPNLVPQYMAKMYIKRCPIRVDIDTESTIVSPDEMKTIVEKLSNIEFIIKNADAFVEKQERKQPISLVEYFCATLYGSLLSYSHDLKELLKGERYLTTCSTFEKKEHKRTNFIKKNLGFIYAHLGSYYKDPDHQDLTSAVNYLLKGCALQNVDCILLLNKLYLDGVEETKPFSSEIITYLHNLYLFNPTNIITNALLKRHYAQEMIAHNDGPISQTQVDTTVVLNTNMLLKIAEQKRHATYSKLICIPEISAFFNQLTLNNNYQKYELLAQQENPDACACFVLAMHNFPANTKLAIDYLQKGIENGVIKSPNTQNYLFKNIGIPNLISQLIILVLKHNNKQQKLLVIKKIKTFLSKYSIDIKAFEEFCQTFYNINLAKSFEWKK